PSLCRCLAEPRRLPGQLRIHRTVSVVFLSSGTTQRSKHTMNIFEPHVQAMRVVLISTPSLPAYFTFAIFTILPFACGSFGSFTTVTYNSFSPSLNATFVVPSPAAISHTCRSLPSGHIFKLLPPNHWAT